MKKNIVFFIYIENVIIRGTSLKKMKEKINSKIKN